MYYLKNLEALIGLRIILRYNIILRGDWTYLVRRWYRKGEMKNRRAFVKGSTTDFSSQSQRQRGSDTLVSSGPSRWRSAWCAERTVSTRSKVDDTQSRNGSVITGSSLCSCKFLHPPGTHLMVAYSRLYSALHLPTTSYALRRSLCRGRLVLFIY